MTYFPVTDTITMTIHSNFKTGNNNPEKTWLPGIFFQDEITFTEKQAITGNALITTHFTEAS
jgi:hypothetical protein